MSIDGEPTGQQKESEFVFDRDLGQDQNAALPPERPFEHTQLGTSVNAEDIPEDRVIKPRPDNFRRRWFPMKDQ